MQSSSTNSEYNNDDYFSGQAVDASNITIPENDDDRNSTDQENQELIDLRESNIRALKSGTLEVKKKSGLLVCLDDKVMRPFKTPCPGQPNHSEEFKRRMRMRKQWFVPFGQKKAFDPNEVLQKQLVSDEIDDNQETVAVSSKEAEEEEEIKPLVLWQSEKNQDQKIQVDGMLVKYLRAHQREGVQFMFDCVTGQRDYEGQGCILADDMGLGKTLQGITLMWTLLKQGHADVGGNPIAKRVIIVCPTSLIGNWDNECKKWLNGQVKTLPLGESTRDEVENGIRQFLQIRSLYQVMIVSYETFRMHSTKFFNREDACDLLICDEAHRLKNDQTKTTKALDGLSCRRRVLLSGTPMQNKLDEFFAMVNFCNPNVLGSPAEFRRRYENPILAGREPDATEKQVQLANERTQQLQAIVDQFILRRTNTILSAHLPPKVIEVVCCKMTPLQTQLYQHFLHSKAAKKLIQESDTNPGTNTTRVLSAITQLRKLCNHPRLIYDTIKSVRTTSVAGKKQSGVSTAEDGFQGCEELLKMAGSGQPGWENLSGKMSLLGRMLCILRSFTKDRIVIVSNYTQTLELISTLCKERNYPYVQLDGSTSIPKRNKLVKQFCDPKNDEFIFLLSSKAGGCGLNLIGANRLILFDPDWNPANDKQAAARVWRDGQKKQVYVYRFLATGSIEEKVYQRQLSKEGLQNVVNQSGQMTSSKMSIEDLRDLFSLQDTVSDTYDTICCGKKTTSEEDFDLTSENTSKKTKKKLGGFSVPKQRIFRAQIGNPNEDELHDWGHHTDVQNVPDQLMKFVGKNDVSFIFSCQITGKQVEIQEALLDEKLVENESQNPGKNNKQNSFFQKNIGRGQQRLLVSAPLLKSSRYSSFIQTVNNNNIINNQQNSKFNQFFNKDNGSGCINFENQEQNIVDISQKNSFSKQGNYDGAQNGAGFDQNGNNSNINQNLSNNFVQQPAADMMEIDMVQEAKNYSKQYIKEKKSNLLQNNIQKQNIPKQSEAKGNNINLEQNEIIDILNFSNISDSYNKKSRQKFVNSQIQNQGDAKNRGNQGVEKNVEKSKESNIQNLLSGNLINNNSNKKLNQSINYLSSKQQQQSCQSLTSMSLRLEQSSNNEDEKTEKMQEKSVKQKKSLQNVTIQVTNKQKDDVTNGVIDLTNLGNVTNVRNVEIAAEQTNKINVQNSINNQNVTINLSNLENTQSVINVENFPNDVVHQNMYDAVKSRKIGYQTGVQKIQSTNLPNKISNNFNKTNQSSPKNTSKKQTLENNKTSKLTKKISNNQNTNQNNQNSPQNLQIQQTSHKVQKSTEKQIYDDQNTKQTNLKSQQNSQFNEKNRSPPKFSVAVIQRERVSQIVADKQNKRPLQQIQNQINQINSNQNSNKSPKLSRFDSPSNKQQRSPQNNTPKSYNNDGRLSKFKLRPRESQEKRLKTMSAKQN